jgi:RHS repeat-associated protein
VNHSGTALCVFAAVLALSVAFTAYGDDPPNCAAAEVSVTDRIVDAGVWGRSYYIDIAHNGVYWIKLHYKGSTELIQVLSNPVTRQLDRNCLSEGDTVQIEAWKTCTEPATTSYTVPPGPPELTLEAVKAPPGLDPSTVLVVWTAFNAWPPRLRGVIHPGADVVKDVTGWDGTRAMGSTTVGIPPGAEGTLLITLSACDKSQQVPIDLDQYGCDKDCKDQCEKMPECVGAPVNTYNGNMRYEDVDPLPSNAFAPLRRTYHSRSSAAGFFGTRWFSMFDAALSVHEDVDGASYVSVTTEDRGVLLFAYRNGAFTEIGPGSAGGSELIYRSDGSWVQTSATGQLQRIFDAGGQPIAFRDVPTGREVQLTWNAGLPSRVADSWGNWALNVVTDSVARRITSISVDGLPGMAWNYVYDTHLVRVDSPVGTWRTYEYVEPGQAVSARRLTAIRDGAGKLIESHAYISGGRAVSSYGPGGDIDSITVREPGRNSSEYSATIHYTSGRTEKHYRRFVAGRWKTVEVSGGCASCGQQAAVAVYDHYGNVIREQAADGYITTTAFDALGQNVIRTRNALRPSDCDPATALDRCLLTTDALADVELIETASTSETTYAYGDPHWPRRPTSTTTSSVLNPGATSRETVIYDAATGEALVRTVRGWTGSPLREETRTTTTTLYDGSEGAAFGPGGGFEAGWLTLPQPRLRKSVDGPRLSVADVAQFVYYPIDVAVPAAWRGRLAAVRNAAGHVQRFENYDVFGNALRIVDANGVVTQHVYDALGRPLSTTLPAVVGCDTQADPLCNVGITQFRTFTGAGPLANEVRAEGGVATYQYDSRGRVSTVTRGPSANDPRERIENQYDPLSGNKSVERWLAFNSGSWVEKKRLTHAYDAEGRLTKTTHADQASVEYTYDARGRILTVRDENHATPNTRYDYDPAGRLVTVEQTLAAAAGGRIFTRYSYDAHGNLTSVTDPNGNVTLYIYDDFGQMLSQSSPVTGVTTYTYDVAGQLTGVTDANGATTTRTYDVLGRVLTSHAVRSGTVEETSWTYDAGSFGLGRLSTMTDPSGSTSYAYDRRGLLRGETKTVGSAVYATALLYDRDGNRTRMTYPTGRVVDTTHDYAGRPLSVTAGTQPIVTAASYLPFGPLASLSFGNGTTRSTTYDSRYRPLTNVLTGPSGAIASYEYGYDAAGNVTRLDDAVDPAYDRTFAYDDLHRLTRADSGSGLWGSGTYAYDAMGNLTAMALGAQTRSFTYVGTTPKLASVAENGTRAVAYDAAGNEIAAGADSSSYSPRNHLATAGDESYVYDGRGLRTVTEDSGPVLALVVVTPSVIFGGESAEGVVTLTAPAGAGGVLVRLVPSPLVQTPSSVVVPEGASSAMFAVAAPPVAAHSPATVTAIRKLTMRATLEVLSSCALDRVTLDAASVTGGTSVAATVFLRDPASANTTVLLAGSDPAVTAPPSVVVPQGASRAGFTIQTAAVASSVGATVTATLCGTVTSPQLTVLPAVVAALSLDPATVIAGNSATAALSLSGAAPQGGLSVATASSDPLVATVPPTVTVPDGTAATTFAVGTPIRDATATAVVSATANGVTRSATLTVLRCTPSPATPQFASGEWVWFDDAPPAGASTNGNWIWDPAVKASGSASLVDSTIAGAHEHWFDQATYRMTPLPSDRLFVYAMLDPCQPPREILFAWYDGATWRRAYWGEDLFTNDPARIRIGDLPAAGSWVRLEVPAWVVSMGGKSIRGMALAVWGGRVWLDRVGKRTCDLANSAPVAQFDANETAWFDDALPTGAQASGNWTWDTSVRASGTRSHADPPSGGLVEHFFQNATATLTVGLSDALTTWVYVDPCNPPRSIMLAWNDGSSWDHRAYWGEDLIPGAARQFIGAIPATTGWVRLEVPSTRVALGGRTIKGMSFVMYGGRVWFDRPGVLRCTFPAPSQPTFGPSDSVWLDDALPSGSRPAGIVWSTVQQVSGTKSLIGDGSATPSDVWFDLASGLTLTSTDVIVAYVLVDPCAPPREIGFAWYDGSWDHRAYWGEDLLPNGTLRVRIGDVPAGAQWVRLEIPASTMNLAGRTVTGMGFYVHGGRAWFDRVGKAPASSGASSQRSASTWAARLSRTARLLAFGRRTPATHDFRALPAATSLPTSAPIAPTTTTLHRHSLYTPELQLLAETSLSASATPPISHEYIWFAGQPVAQIETATHTVHYYFNDHLGTPVLTTNATATIDWRIEREPYGQTHTTRVGADRHQPLSFPGQEEDREGERSYNIFRWYRAGWGRYTSADPLLLDMRRENEYGYVRGNPLRFTDRLGLSATLLCRPVYGAGESSLGKTVIDLYEPLHCRIRVNCKCPEYFDKTVGRELENGKYPVTVEGFSLEEYGSPWFGTPIQTPGGCQFEKCVLANAKAQSEKPSLLPKYNALFGPNSNTWWKGMVTKCGGQINPPPKTWSGF